MMDSSDSHAILSKTKIDAFSSVNIDLRNLDLDVKNRMTTLSILLIILKQMMECFRFPIRCRMIRIEYCREKGHESYSYIHIDINFLQEMLGQSHVIENSNKVTVYIPRKTDLSGFSCKMGYGDISVESLNAQKQ